MPRTGGEITTESRPARALASVVAAAVLLLAVGVMGYLAWLAFVRGVLAPGEFAGYGLVLSTVFAATASFFSPCSFTVLPSYISFAGDGAGQARRVAPTLLNGLAAAAGVVAAVASVGVLIGTLGLAIGPELSITGDNPNPVVRGLRIGIGTFVLAMGLTHLLNLSHRIPLLGRIASWAVRAEGSRPPSRWSRFLYGAGYVVVGIG